MKLKILSRKFLILTLGFIVATITIFYFLFTRNDIQESNCSIPIPENYCGIEKLSENQQKGKELFNETCAACHKKRFKSTGPALGDIDSLKYWKWLKNTNKEIDSTKFELLGIDYHHNLSNRIADRNKIRQIFEYIKAE